MKVKLFIFVFSLTFPSFSNSAKTPNYNHISHKIKKVNANLDKKHIDLYSQAILNASNKHNIKPDYFIAIIQVESSFRNIKSHTGDYSIAQINYNQWSKEFKRLNLRPLNYKLLKNNPHYAVDRMGEILKIKKQRNPQDPLWFARYHSKTPKLKKKYAQKVINNLNKINETLIANK